LQARPERFLVATSVDGRAIDREFEPGTARARALDVYYRDPNVLGGCPATSTFNATQSGQVSWWP
jgi:hypothetical protein